MIKKTEYYSWLLGSLPRGCKLCVKGRKLVLFVTGICPRSCFYCSISDSKYQHDVIYANERQVTKTSEIIEEAKTNKATGAGFTGGDPLTKIERTLSFIKGLKKRFGNNFHIHIYTTPESTTKAKLKALKEAGLNEIRLHPDLDNQKNWQKLKLPSELNWDYGIEIPAIPGYETKTIKLINYAKDWIQFLNLNELEISDNSQNKLNELGYFTKSPESYAARGSQETALEIMKYCYSKHFRFDVHYCTAKLKDRVQLANRIMLRARSIKQGYDKLTKDGTLVRGAIYIPGLEPGAQYRERLAKLKTRDNLFNQLEQVALGLKLKDYSIDKAKLRILCSKKELKRKAKLVKILGMLPAIVEEYPTYDNFLVEVEFI